MYAALDLAKYIVAKCIRDGHPINNIQLQKILYCIQEDYLRRDTLAFPEDIDARQFGPAIPDVYYYFCGHGCMPISFITSCEKVKIEESDRRYIDPIIERKRDLKPWNFKIEACECVYNNGRGSGLVITPKMIKSADRESDIEIERN